MRLAITAGIAGCIVAIGLFAVARADALVDATRAYRTGDYATAVSLLTPLAVQGNAQAQSLLGAMFLNGEAGSVDYGRALGWLRKAADQGDTAAENDMGLIYCKGLGVARDFTEGLRWYHKAADQGDAVAALNVGLIYDLGEGVAVNASVAATWYTIAANGGDATAQYNLGLLYDAGRGVGQNSTEAVRLWNLAAAHGEPDAQSSLGAAFASGRGVPLDLVQAYAWFSLAALGYPDTDPADRAQAEHNRDIVVAKMTAAEIRQGQHIVEQWRPAPPGPALPATPRSLANSGGQANSSQSGGAAPAATPAVTEANRSGAGPPPSASPASSVQLGAYLAEADAWAKLQQVGPLPEGLKADVVSAVSGGRRWFRAIVVGFAGRSQASDFCAERRLSSADCWVH